MLFSSLIFLFVFFTLNLIVYVCFAKTIRQKNMVMLGFSLFFYMWGGPRFLILLLAMTAISWISALLVDAMPYGGSRKAVLVVCCGLMLGLLGVFKYTGFFLSNLQALTGFPKTIPNIVLPLGISFYTFQLLSYVVDVYRGEVEAQRRYWLLLLYASMFHQCIAGPIIRYRDISRQIRFRTMDLSSLSRGIGRFAAGLAKKTVLANSCAYVADTLIPGGVEAIGEAPAAALWLGILFYMLQIYLDFSAYSDMAIGMGQMIGFTYKENFDYPYTAVSVTDFWRRWHISLGSFFRDYVYIPLGGNRRGKGRQVFNMFIVWFLTGMWHGASWNFILWGLYFFVFLVLEKYVLGDVLDRAPKFFSHIYLIAVIYFSWILFRFESLKEILAVLKGMICLNGNALSDFRTGVLFQNELFFLIIAIIAVTPLMKNLGEIIRRVSMKRFEVPYVYYACQVLIPPILLLMSVMALVGDSYNPFIYFRF